MTPDDHLQTICSEAKKKSLDTRTHQYVVQLPRGTYRIQADDPHLSPGKKVAVFANGVQVYPIGARLPKAATIRQLSVAGWHPYTTIVDR